MTDHVATIREMEIELARDPKKINHLIAIKKYLKDDKAEYKVKVAAIHSLRRLLLSFLADGLLCPVVSTGDEAQSSAKTKQSEFRNWLVTQYNAFLASLCDLIVVSSENRNGEKLQVLSIKTLLEFVSSEWKTQVKFVPGNDDGLGYFGYSTFKMILTSLLKNDKVEISAEVLIMLKDEIFKYSDCSYFGLSVLHAKLQELRKASSSGSSSSSGGGVVGENSELKHVTRNAIDLLRIISVPEDEESLKANFLVDPSNSNSPNDIDDSNLNDDGSDDDEDDKLDESDIIKRDSSNNKNGGKNSKSRNDAIADEVKRKKYTPEEEELLMNLLGKRKSEDKPSTADSEKKSKKLKPTKRHEKLVHLPSYRKLFGATWLSLLALPLNTSQHKLILKHLPLFVMETIPKPILLADYLTKSFECGGVVAVLALEGLFQLIVKFNLDYPQFFTSLYRLCTVEIFTAKYRPTFLKLLSASLKSVNLPVYLVAAFIKRLSSLALQIPSPAALYCVTQSTWLLRKHPQAQVLIQRDDGATCPSRNVSGVLYDTFDIFEDTKIEKCNAINSSLWELKILENHHFHSVSTLARSLLESKETTENGMNATFLNLDDFIEHSYVDIMEEELKHVKKFGALAHIPPTSLYRVAASSSSSSSSSNSNSNSNSSSIKIGGNLIDDCFGGKN